MTEQQERARWSIEDKALASLCRQGMDMHDESAPEYVVCAALLQRLEAAPSHPVGSALLEGIVELAREAHAHWDADREAKVGKILLALAGYNERYDRRSDALHAALAAPVAPEPAKCLTCNGNGMIGGFVSADSGYDSLPCPDCNPASQPAEAVSDVQLQEIIWAKHFRKGYWLKESDKMCIEWWKQGFRDAESFLALAGTQAADPIYQIRNFNEESQGWYDASVVAYRMSPEADRRIVYVAHKEQNNG